MASEPASRPAAEFRAGTVVAAIWTKSSTIGNGYQTLSQMCSEKRATWLRRIPFSIALSSLLVDTVDP